MSISVHRLTSSCRRSAQFGVDPKYVVDDILTGSELADRRAKLEPIYTFLNQLSYMVLIADLDGYIVSSLGRSPFEDKVKTVALEIGANWHERVKGTNAIGTALVEGRPISVIGGEHFVHDNHILTCYAAPLYDAEGKPVGVLDISGDARAHHPETSGLVVALAMALQSHLLLTKSRKELTLTIAEAEAMTRSVFEPLMSIDGDGRITRMNEQAARRFNMTVEQCIGRSIEMLFGRRCVGSTAATGRRSSKGRSLDRPGGKRRAEPAVRRRFILSTG